jgi:signal transduction histidine kinase
MTRPPPPQRIPQRLALRLITLAFLFPTALFKVWAVDSTLSKETPRGGDNTITNIFALILAISILADIYLAWIFALNWNQRRRLFWTTSVLASIFTNFFIASGCGLCIMNLFAVARLSLSDGHSIIALSLITAILTLITSSVTDRDRKKLKRQASSPSRSPN